jgi:hypothetical protein
VQPKTPLSFCCGHNLRLQETVTPEAMSTAFVAEEELPHSPTTTIRVSEETTRIPHKDRNIIDLVGFYTAIFIVLSSVLLLGSYAFISWFWIGSNNAIAGKLPPRILLRIVRKEMVNQSITISTAVIRIVMSIHSSIITSIVAAVLLEQKGSNIAVFPFLSIVRSVRIQPYNLLWNVRHYPLPAQSARYLSLAALCLATSAVSQFYSTILLSDLESRAIVVPERPYKYYWYGSSDTEVDGDIFWKSKPINFPTFAEYKEPGIIHPGVQDTGLTYRAFPPFYSSQDRSALREYSGLTKIMDSRVLCIRPDISFNSTKVLYSRNGQDYISETHAYLTLTGGIGWQRSNYDFLEPSLWHPELGGPSEVRSTTFNCTVRIGGNNAEWPLTLCNINPVAILPHRLPNDNVTKDENYKRQERGRHATFLLLNVTQDATEWKKTMTLNDSAPVRNARPILDGKVNKNDWSEEDSDSWIIWKSRKRDVALSSTLCLTTGYGTEYGVKMTSDQDNMEPSISLRDFMYDDHGTSGIRFLYGAIKNGSRRAVLNLEPPSGWRDYWYSTKIQSVGPLWAFAFLQGRSPTVRLLNKPIITLSSVKYDLPATIAHPILVTIFQDIIQSTRDPSLALQTVFTIISQAAYYDWIPKPTKEYFSSRKSNAALSFSRQYNIPCRWRGFFIVTSTIAVHMFVLTTALVLFWRSSRYTLLGNAWQGVAQAITEDTEPVFDKAVDMTDSEVWEELKRTRKDKDILYIGSHRVNVQSAQ